MSIYEAFRETAAHLTNSILGLHGTTSNVEPLAAVGVLAAVAQASIVI